MIFQHLTDKLAAHLLSLLSNPATCERGLKLTDDISRSSKYIYPVVYEQLEKKLIDRCAQMAMNEMYISNARSIAKQIKVNQYGLFKDFPENVKRRIDEKKNQA